MKKKIAITGGIGSGKSTASQYLRELGFKVFSCDEIYREIILSPEYIEEIKKCFPTAVMHGKVDRRALSELVFQYPEKLIALNKISHPLIMKRLFADMNDCQDELVFAEVPLLFEGNFESFFDAVIVIYRNLEKRIKAIQKRNDLEYNTARKRIQAQFDYDSEEGKRRISACNHYTIYNDSTIESLHQNLERLLHEI